MLLLLSGAQQVQRIEFLTFMKMLIARKLFYGNLKILIRIVYLQRIHAATD